MTHESPIKQRIQITFGKFGALKYTSNLDVAKIWERVLRRADLPILYSKGFNTRPRIQLVSALPLGITSECEMLDVSLKEPMALDGVIERLLVVGPDGLRIYAIREAPVNSPTLQSLVRSAEYRITFPDGIDRARLQQAVDEIIAAESVMTMRKKKGKKTSADLRPLVYELRADEHGDLIAHLAVGDQGNLRPDDLLSEMGLDELYHNIHRFRLHIDASAEQAP